MLRVLLVLEDYGELMFLQTVLKKIGFDVDSTQNPRKISDSLLSLNPDVVVMTAAGKRIRGLDVVPGIKRNRGIPRVILIRTGAMGPDVPQDLQVEAWLDSPVAAPDLLDKIAELNGLNKQILQEKLLKLRINDEDSEVRVLKITGEGSSEPTMGRSEQPVDNWGALKASSLSSSDRQSRYRKIISETQIEHKGFVLKDVQAQVRQLRQEETETDVADLERQRRAFVEHLFKKKIN